MIVKKNNILSALTLKITEMYNSINSPDCNNPNQHRNSKETRRSVVVNNDDTQKEPQAKSRTNFKYTDNIRVKNNSLNSDKSRAIRKENSNHKQGRMVECVKSSHISPYMIAKQRLPLRQALINSQLA